jgi:hypothetical protein
VSTLRNIIKNAGGSMDAFTVMTSTTDPYRIDTPASHRNALWLSKAWKAFGMAQIHTRGLHYALVSMPNLIKPDGKPYINSAEDWIFLQRIVGHARWLGYIDFDAITDERNAGPEIFLHPEVDDAGVKLKHNAEHLCWSPSLPVVSVVSNPPVARQAYRLVLIGEKSSLRNVLRPICKKYEAELVLPTGELSTTLLYGIVRRAADDGRPCRIFYLSDFDPTGIHMPIEVSRKIQALCHLKFQNLDIELRRCALLVDQVKTLGLPETPMKDSEKRAGKWRQRFGCEQTEIDALATLRPDVLNEIVERDLTPFFDFTLQERQKQAYKVAQDTTQQIVDKVVSHYQTELHELSALIQNAAAALKVASSIANPLFDKITRQIAPVEPRSVEPQLNHRNFGDTLFSSLDSFEVTTSRLLEEKL